MISVWGGCSNTVIFNMISHYLDWKHNNERIGCAHLIIVNSREEAEDSENGWFENFDIYQQLEAFNIPESYPALLLVWMDIDENFKSKKHGSHLLKYINNYAFENNCSFQYCKVNTGNEYETRTKNQAFYKKNNWEIFACKQGNRIPEPCEVEAFIMAYKSTTNTIPINDCYSAEKITKEEFLED